MCDQARSETTTWPAGGVVQGREGLDEGRAGDEELPAVEHAADVQHDELAGADADLQRQRQPLAGLVAVEFGLQRQGAVDSRAVDSAMPFGRVGVPGGQHGVAGEADHVAAVGRDDRDHPAEIVVQHPAEHFGASAPRRAKAAEMAVKPERSATSTAPVNFSASGSSGMASAGPGAARQRRANSWPIRRQARDVPSIVHAFGVVRRPAAAREDQ